VTSSPSSKAGNVLASFVTFLWIATLMEGTIAVGYTHAGAMMVCDGAAVADPAADGDDSRPRGGRAIVDEDQVASYRRDGFVLIRGALDGALVERIARAGRAVADRATRYPQYFSVMENGLIFRGADLSPPASSSDPSSSSVAAAPSRNDPPEGQHPSDPSMDSAAVFREAAIYSKIPQIAAELMELDADSQNLRVLR
jgi:hypothetical protein